MQIGRKIYYEKATGNVLVDCGERIGDVVETTTEQDFEMYIALQPYVQSSVGIIQLEYGQDSDKFGLYNYSIDTTTHALVWGSLINPDIQVPQPTIDDKLASIEQQNLDIMQGMADIWTKLNGGTV